MVLECKDTLYYICKDRQGSITALIRQDQSVAEKFSYDAWGRRRNPANWADFNVKTPRLISRGYTGHEMLDAFGLINMNGRIYDPVIGRVLSPDNYVQDATNTQSYNRYSYCLNNPLRYSDPSGWLALANFDNALFDMSSAWANRINNPDSYFYSSGYMGGGGGGGGGFGLPGQGKNGTGLGGVYYDWSSSAYRRDENPSWVMDWFYVNKNIVQKSGVTYNYGAYYNSLQGRNSANDQKMADAAVSSWSEANRGYGLMGSIVEPPQEFQPPEVPVPLKVLYAVLFTGPVAISIEMTGSAESGGASSATPAGFLFMLQGPDANHSTGFSSAGVGGGALGASGMVTCFKYYYSGNNQNLRMQAFKGGGQWTAGITGGEGLVFGISISFMQDRFNHGEYIVGCGGGVGAGVGLPLSGQGTWNTTYFW